MKKTPLVALMLMASGALNAAEIYNKDGNKLDLYGKVDARHLFSDDSSNNGDATYARLGFSGETQVNTLLTGYGRWEHHFNVASAEGMQATKTRLGFAGLKLDEYGSVDYGRNFGVIYDVAALTDVLPVFGGDTLVTTDNFMTGRASNLLTYRNSGFFGLAEGADFALQFQGRNGGDAETSNSRGTAQQNGDGLGTSLAWAFGDGFSASVAWSGSRRTADLRLDTANNAAHAEAWATGLKYDANNPAECSVRLITPTTRALLEAGDISATVKRKSWARISAICASPSDR